MGNNAQFTILLVAIGSIFSVLLAFIWIAVRLGPKGRGRGPANQSNGEDIFSDEYRDKLRERGIMRFQNTLDQNAVFLQKDLQRVSEEVGEYIKEHVGDILKDQLNDQKQTLIAAEERMAQSFSKVDKALEDYRLKMIEEMKNELALEKQRRIEYLENNLTDVVAHYIKETLAAELDVSEQMESIVANLEANKTAITEDLKREV